MKLGLEVIRPVDDSLHRNFCGGCVPLQQIPLQAIPVNKRARSSLWLSEGAEPAHEPRPARRRERCDLKQRRYRESLPFRGCPVSTTDAVDTRTRVQGSANHHEPDTMNHERALFRPGQLCRR